MESDAKSVTVFLEQHPKINSDKLYVENTELFEVGDEVVINFGKPNEERFKVKESGPSSDNTTQQGSTIASHNQIDNPYIVVNTPVTEQHNRHATEIFNMTAIQNATECDSTAQKIMTLAFDLVKTTPVGDVIEVVKTIDLDFPVCEDSTVLMEGVSMEMLRTSQKKDISAEQKEAILKFKMTIDSVIFEQKVLIKSSLFDQGVGYIMKQASSTCTAVRG